MIRLAIMRPYDKLEESVTLATAYGFDPLCASPLKVQAWDSAELDEFLERLGAGGIDMVVLTSSTGVDCLMSMLDPRSMRDRALSWLNRTDLVAIGPITAEAMRRVGLASAFVPKVHSSEGLVAELSGDSIAGKRIVLLRSDHGELSLVDGLRALGAHVDDIVIYRLIQDTDSPELNKMVEESLAGRVDVFAFTSSLSARTFIEAAERTSPDKIRAVLRARTVAAMGEPTKRKLEELGIKVDVVPSAATFEDMLLSIRQAVSPP